MTKASYHHGDLRHQLIAAAVDEIGRNGPAALSLRALARALGVSHAAPTHHFGDKTGLLTAVAIDGYRLLAEALGHVDGLLDLGIRYAVFATEHQAHFEVMFTPTLLDAADAELAAVRDQVGRQLRDAVAEQLGDRNSTDDVAAAWAIAHGFAELWRSGAMPALLGHPTIDEGARRVLTRLDPAHPLSP